MKIQQNHLWDYNKIMFAKLSPDLIQTYLAHFFVANYGINHKMHQRLDLSEKILRNCVN